MKKLALGLFSNIFHAFPYFTFRLANWFSNLKLYNHMSFLKKRGIAINVVYDIGARHGVYSRELKSVLPKARFFLFEANASCSSILDRTGFRYFISALSTENDREVEFYSLNSSCDSYFKENTDRFKDVKPKRVKTRSLASLAEEHGLPQPDMIKLDTQGSEIDILKGAESLLANCSLVHIEAPVIEANQGAPTFSEYLAFFESRGFRILDITQQHHQESWGGLFQLDILFLRKDLF